MVDIRTCGLQTLQIDVKVMDGSSVMSGMQYGQQVVAMVSLLFLSGSSQLGSTNWRLPRAAAALAARAFAGRVTSNVLELDDLDLPTYEPEGAVPHELNPLKQEISRADGIFMSSDEYTGAYSAMFKNAVAWLMRDTPDKPPFGGLRVALVGTAARGAGGLRGHPALRQLLEELGAEVISQHLELGTDVGAFDREGNLLPRLEKQLVSGSLAKLVAEQ
jgi:NAD(P)H-dependent FMN reductase